MALKLIKNKIRSTQRTGKVTKAMEAVSAVKMRKSQERALAGRSYARAALRILGQISGTQEGVRHAFAADRGGSRHCYIVVTSDKGLAGSVNSAVLKLLESSIAGVSSDDLTFITFGRKATEYVTNRNYAVLKSFVNMSDTVSLDEMDNAVRVATDAFVDMRCDYVSIIYQNFISTFEQHPTKHQLLPLREDAVTAIVRGIVSTRGSHVEVATEESSIAQYTIEPSAEEVVDLLVPRLLSIMLYHALLESKASEHSARMVAMKNATDKAKEMTKLLTLAFNKERQAVITREVSEITGGIEAMAR